MDSPISQQRRVIYIEDSPNQRAVIGNFLTAGLQNEYVSVDAREGFSQLRQELEQGIIPDILITDDEILSGGTGRGVEMARQVIKKAQELGREVLVITLLCSNADAARTSLEKYRSEDNFPYPEMIPCLDKNTQAALCGLYVARILKDGNRQRDGSILTFEAWLKEESITLLKDQAQAREADRILRAQIESSSDLTLAPFTGGLYEPISNIISKRMKREQDSAQALRNVDQEQYQNRLARIAMFREMFNLSPDHGIEIK